jgi:cyclic pyranopterin phosphate synthase
MRGVNEAELWPLVCFAAERRMLVRFIELMPVSNAGVLGDDRFFSVGEAMRILSGHDSLAALPEYRPGNGPARYFELARTQARVGFIGAMTTPDFCGTCNKLRLTADGKLRPCLGRHGELDLLPALRGEGDLRGSIEEAIRNKPENHEFAECYEPGRPMTAIGG